MANCKSCNQNMMDNSIKSCTKWLKIEEGLFRRNSRYFDDGKRCHDCNIENKPGNYHHLGCDMERCPFCNGQLISCGCAKFQGSVSPEVMAQLTKEAKINT